MSRLRTITGLASATGLAAVVIGVLANGPAVAQNYWYADNACYSGYAWDSGYGGWDSDYAWDTGYGWDPWNSYDYEAWPYAVVEARVGYYESVLPSSYTTVWVSGSPYYYANDTYYVWRQSGRQYEVVAPPYRSAASTDARPPSSNGDMFVYPKNGQSAETQARDKYECHKWARNGSGFDPTKAAGGVAAEESDAKRAAYQRAMGACLEGRGYSVK